MRIAIIGDRANCSFCKSLAKTVGTYPVPANATAKEAALYEAACAAFNKWMAACSGCVLVDADKKSGVYSQYKAASLTKPIAGRPDGKYPWPVVSVYDGDTLKGSFVARNLTAAKLIAKIEAMCPGCNDCADGACDDGKTKTCPTCKGKVCPTCGGKLVVPA